MTTINYNFVNPNAGQSLLQKEAIYENSFITEEIKLSFLENKFYDRKESSRYYYIRIKLAVF